MAIKLINFGFSGEDSKTVGVQTDKEKKAYVIRGNNLKVSKHSKPLKRFESKPGTQRQNVEEEVAEMPNTLGEVAMCSQQKLNIDNKDMTANSTIAKRPYSAHGFKVTKTKLKLTRTKEINNEDYVKAYKEKILAVDKDLFDFCFNNQRQEEEKKNALISKNKKKAKLNRRYMQTANTNNTGAIKIGGNTCVDDYNNEEDNENKEKINKTKQLIQDNANKYKYTNEMLAELGKVAPSDDVNKLMVSMADDNIKNNEVEMNQCRTEIDEEAENLAYEQLNERIKKQIKEKGTYDFSKLSKEDRDLLLKKKIYIKKPLEPDFVKKETKMRPLTSTHIQYKRKRLNKEEEALSSKKKKDKNKKKPRKKYDNNNNTDNKQDNEMMNECLDYIPKPAMSGFLLRAYKSKQKGKTIINENKSTTSNEKNHQFKARNAPNFNTMKDNKEILHPLLADYGRI